MNSRRLLVSLLNEKSMSKIKVEIWSDIACPYCYIGKRKFEKALEQFPRANDVEVIWHSYELNPDLPKGTHSEIGKNAHYNSNSNKKLQALAAEVGLEYNLDKLVYANTSDALRLVKLAKEKGLATEAEEVLFKAYFTDGKNVSSRQMLIEAGTSIGLDKAEIEELLDSERFLQEIKDDIAYSENVLNLEYIPFYQIDGKVTIEGSLAIDEYVKALEAAVSGNDDATSFSGQSCSIDGVCS